MFDCLFLFFWGVYSEDGVSSYPDDVELAILIAL